ncbi:MAG: NAD-dependent epimerase/dehydratase family protein [Anaerolineae bacterium]|nr:NAD-dependent epimerase/dehydratase family protein [Anaerolineae bacterium]
MKYFVTGATGFIGGSLVRQLRAAGHDVLALVRSPQKASHLQALGIQLAPGDITDRASLRAPMTGVDGVFHTAGWYRVGVRNTDAGAKINIDGTRNVLETMKELNIPKGVYTSTLAVNSDTHGRLVDESYHYDGPHLTEYDRTKAVAHHRIAGPLMQAGLPLVMVMPGLTYGPGDHSDMHEVMVQYLKGQLPMAAQGVAFCWAHVEDVARGHILAMEQGRAGESYIICGEPMTLVAALKLAEKITGIPAPRLNLPPVMSRTASALAGLVEPFIALPSAYSRESLRISAGVTYWGDNGKAKRELGYDPRPLADGLRETLAYDLRELEIQPPKPE